MRELVQARLNPLDSGLVLDDNDAKLAVVASCRDLGPLSGVGHYGHPALIRAARLEDLAFTEGRGPNPATKDNASGFMEEDPLQ